MDDPRQILERAAEKRCICEILPRRGGWGRGQLQRVERGGVVVHAPDAKLATGEDLRCWFALDGAAYTFEASVIREGISVPDRSQHGYLLGFIDRWTAGEAGIAPEHGLDLCILPPNGPGISLVHGPGRLVDLMVDRVGFTLPSEHKVVFVAQGRTRLRFSVPGMEAHEAGGRVSELVPGDVLHVYSVAVDAVADAEAHRSVVTALSRALEMGPGFAGR
jgi:hypothetical protein